MSWSRAHAFRWFSDAIGANIAGFISDLPNQTVFQIAFCTSSPLRCQCQDAVVARRVRRFVGLKRVKRLKAICLYPQTRGFVRRNHVRDAR